MLCYPYCDFSGSGCVLPQQAPSSINGFLLGYVIDDNVQCYGHAWGYVHPVSRREGGVFSSRSYPAKRLSLTGFTLGVNFPCAL